MDTTKIWIKNDWDKIEALEAGTPEQKTEAARLVKMYAQSLEDRLANKPAPVSTFEPATIHNFRVGDKVQLLPVYQSRKPYGEMGIVEKINPKRLKVRFGMVRYTVPPSMLNHYTENGE